MSFSNSTKLLLNGLRAEQGENQNTAFHISGLHVWAEKQNRERTLGEFMLGFRHSRYWVGLDLIRFCSKCHLFRYYQNINPTHCMSLDSRNRQYIFVCLFDNHGTTAQLAESNGRVNWGGLIGCTSFTCPLLQLVRFPFENCHLRSFINLPIYF